MWTAPYRLALAAALRELGRLGEAEAEIALASDEVALTSGPISRGPLLATLALAELRLKQKRRDEALQLAAPAVRRLTELVDRAAPDRFEALLTLAAASTGDERRLALEEALAIVPPQSQNAERVRRLAAARP
jgi:hypothetical protein